MKKHAERQRLERHVQMKASHLSYSSVAVGGEGEVPLQKASYGGKGLCRLTELWKDTVHPVGEGMAAGA